jgi:uncharacterized membrane protein YkoI
MARTACQTAAAAKLRLDGHAAAMCGAAPGTLSQVKRYLPFRTFAGAQTMRIKMKSTVILAAVSSVLVFGAAQASDSAKHEAEALRTAKVSLTEAIHIAEKQGNGHAISAEFEFKGGDPAYYDVKVLSSDGSKLTRFDLNPTTGKIKETSNEKFEKLFTRIKPTSIQNAPTSLTRAIATAEQRSGGRATQAQIDRDGDQVKYTVEIVKLDGESEKIKVNGSDGKVASAP